jgi:hypothetical protein
MRRDGSLSTPSAEKACDFFLETSHNLTTLYNKYNTSSPPSPSGSGGLDVAHPIIIVCALTPSLVPLDHFAWPWVTEGTEYR